MINGDQKASRGYTISHLRASNKELSKLLVKAKENRKMEKDHIEEESPAPPLLISN